MTQDLSADRGLQAAEYRQCQAPRNVSDDVRSMEVGDDHRVQVLFSDVPGTQLVFSGRMMISFCTQASDEGCDREICLF